jgi:hypothetical protein
MAEIKSPVQVKLIIGILSSSPDLFSKAENHLHRKFGPIDYKTGLIPFTFTTYYNESMGELIKRQFLSFAKLINPGEIGRIKVWTNQLEMKIARKFAQINISRPINLDPGYLNTAKIVLASTKDYSHRIYLSHGIYAEVTLHYQNGVFQSWPWTYPDYQTKKYLDFFQAVRQKYVIQLKG